MAVDIEAMRRLYGQAPRITTSTTFGFNSTITGRLADIYDFARNRTPVVTLCTSRGAGVVNTLELSGFSQAASINWFGGSVGSAGGLVNTIIAPTAIIRSVIGASGDDALTGYGGAQTFRGNGGNDFIDDRGGDDTAMCAGNRSRYTARLVNGDIVITDGSGLDGIDTVRNVEFFTVADRTVSAAQLIAGSKAIYSISVGPSKHIEGSNPARKKSFMVAVARTNADSAATVDVVMSGTADPSDAGKDCSSEVFALEKLTFAAGVLQAVFYAEINPGVRLERSETIVATISNPTDGGTVARGLRPRSS